MGIDVCKACGRMWDDQDLSFVGQQVFGAEERGPNLCPKCKGEPINDPDEAERKLWDARG